MLNERHEVVVINKILIDNQMNTRYVKTYNKSKHKTTQNITINLQENVSLKFIKILKTLPTNYKTTWVDIYNGWWRASK